MGLNSWASMFRSSDGPSRSFAAAKLPENRRKPYEIPPVVPAIRSVLWETAASKKGFSYS